MFLIVEESGPWKVDAVKAGLTHSLADFRIVESRVSSVETEERIRLLVLGLLTKMSRVRPNNSASDGSSVDCEGHVGYEGEGEDVGRVGERRVNMGNKLSSKQKKKRKEKVASSLQIRNDFLTGRSLTTEREKCYDPRDRTLTFVNGDDDLDFLCEDFKSLRAKMSCGHAVTPMSLTNWCRRLLDQGECRFVCGQTDCHVEWPFEEVCKMALLTKEEMEYFEKTLFRNVAQDYLDVKVCPGCKSRVVRADLSELSVECTTCTAAKKRPYMFCWQCLREWRGPAPRSDRCENYGCINQPLETLRNCLHITFNDVRGVTGCPCIRACPTCGLLVEHNKTQCKNIICLRCKVEFCFVCLKLTEECLKSSTHFQACSTGVAPRQTSIPVWQRK
ncbi:probable E3 ubiquitin-protein ligase ARI5 [Micropterus dolomieu]|uniref:probable E3 ubiquitin-protein ligase ARI5 n=1 Tax=Micropterus dolomieu TaxID=147949 RepID=UPI001E8D0405|nr:probable E3 ubiquitin-protein ligase ARI5 [Micropterus dolomieu]